MVAKIVIGGHNDLPLRQMSELDPLRSELLLDCADRSLPVPS
jgi:hypothetical protein